MRRLLTRTPFALALVVVLLAVLVGPRLAGVAAGDRAPGLCKEDTSRLVVPDDFVVNACFDGHQIVVENDTTLAYRLEHSAGAGSPVSLPVLQSVPDWLVSIIGTSADPDVLFPGERVAVPVSGSDASVKVVYDRDWSVGLFFAQGLYGIAGDVPVVGRLASPGLIDAGIDFVNEVRTVTENLSACLSRASNALGKIGCNAGYSGNLTFAVGRLVAKAALDFVPGSSLIDLAKRTLAQVEDQQSRLHDPFELSVPPAAAVSEPPAAARGEPARPVPEAAQQPQPTLQPRPPVTPAQPVPPPPTTNPPTTDPPTTVPPSVTQTALVDLTPNVDLYGGSVRTWSRPAYNTYCNVPSCDPASVPTGEVRHGQQVTAACQTHGQLTVTGTYPAVPGYQDDRWVRLSDGRYLANTWFARSSLRSDLPAC
jgi:hypothetical protein